MTAIDPASLNPSSTTVLWQGTSSDATNILSGGKVSSSSYTVTEDAVKFASGVLSTSEEYLPLILVRDADLKQSMTQKARGVGDLILKVDLAAAPQYGQRIISIRSIKEPASVRDLILRQANQIRSYWAQINHDRLLESQRAGAMQIHSPAQASAPTAGPSMLDQLTQLGQLKAQGVLTDEEFAQAKAKLLG